MSKNTLHVKSCEKIQGELRIPGDKSISHRAVILSSLSCGKSTISNFLMSADCLNTLNAFRQMGISIQQVGNAEFVVNGKGLNGLSKPSAPLDMGNSGTGMRLVAGVLASQNFDSIVVGDESLSTRPMKRITVPLSVMGAHIETRNGNYPPLDIKGRQLAPITYELPIASAQVKSAILLAALNTSGTTTVIEPVQSRDHTERMLAFFGADIQRRDTSISVMGKKELTARDVVVPGDISSAAFFLVAAAAKPGASLLLKDVGLNPTRHGILELLKRMGSNIEVREYLLNENELSEPRGDILITGGQLHGITIQGADIPIVIDELPILAVAGALADGVTVIKDAKELRVKESDRIAAMALNLRAIGCEIEEFDDGMKIYGKIPFHGAKIDSFGDHRIAMAMSIAGLFLHDGTLIINNTKNIDTSFPDYETYLTTICS